MGHLQEPQTQHTSSPLWSLEVQGEITQPAPKFWGKHPWEADHKHLLCAQSWAHSPRSARTVLAMQSECSDRHQHVDPRRAPGTGRVTQSHSTAVGGEPGAPGPLGRVLNRTPGRAVLRGNFWHLESPEQGARRTGQPSTWTAAAASENQRDPNEAAQHDQTAPSPSALCTPDIAIKKSTRAGQSPVSNTYLERFLESGAP